MICRAFTHTHRKTFFKTFFSSKRNRMHFYLDMTTLEKEHFFFFVSKIKKHPARAVLLKIER